MTIAGLAGLAAQTPAGAFTDHTRAKRGLIVAAALVVTAASAMLPLVSSFGAVAATQAAAGAAGVLFAPAVAAITLGLMGSHGFSRRIGRNETFNHVGNAFAAAVAGLAAWKWGPSVVFVLMAGMALLSIVSVLSIDGAAIDRDRARGLIDGAARPHEKLSALKTLAAERRLLIFCLCCVSFHFANAAMLPLVGQKLALQDKNLGTALMSACIVGAQIVMVPMAALVGRKADSIGRKPLFLAAFAILPLRAFLYTLSNNPYWRLGVQMLDGVGAGLYGALFIIIVADLTRGSGHFNLAQGAVITAQGIGAALSTTFAGEIVVRAGYSAAFLALGGVAAGGFLLYFFAMPETLLDEKGGAGQRAPAIAS